MREGVNKGMFMVLICVLILYCTVAPMRGLSQDHKRRCLPPEPVAYTKKEFRDEWGEQEIDYITVERGGDKLKGCQERGSDGRHFRVGQKNKSCSKLFSKYHM